LNQLTDDLTAKKKKLDTATQKSDDFKKELELINAKIKQYTDERTLVPGDAKLYDMIEELKAKKVATGAEKKDIDDEIITLTGEYADLETKYTKYGVPN
jgi:chromosome segregation ATPase